MDEKTTILFVTSNLGKLSEAKIALKPFGLNVEAFQFNEEIQEIQSSNLHFVTADKLTKAVSIVKNSSHKLGVMVEDAGFFLEEYSGFPGVYSAYVHKTLGNQGILRTLNEVENRGAIFRCVIGIYLNDREIYFEGLCKGQVSKKARGKNGFGYDPIFIPDGGDGRTFAEMTSEEKQIFSHRGKALKKLRDYFEERNQSPTSNHGSES